MLENVVNAISSPYAKYLICIIMRIDIVYNNILTKNAIPCACLTLIISQF